MKKFFKDLMTEDDGKTWCWARFTATLGLGSYWFNSGYILYKTGSLPLTDFATGFATILAAGGATVAMKQFSTAAVTATPVVATAPVVTTAPTVTTGTPDPDNPDANG